MSVQIDCPRVWRKLKNGDPVTGEKGLIYPDETHGYQITGRRRPSLWKRPSSETCTTSDPTHHRPALTTPGRSNGSTMPTDTAAKIASAKLRLALSQLVWAELERLGLTVYSLAKAAELGVQTVRDITAGASDPSLSRVLALERALGRPPGWIAKQLG